MNVLELGPLEGGHTYMLQNAGANEIVSIEANTLNYMKCLLVKEIFVLDRAQFLLGDFVEYLSQSDAVFDLVVASGVLYHLIDPLPAILGMMKRSKRIFIWSHFFDDKVMPASDPRRAAFTGKTVEREVDGFKATYYMRSYGGTHHAKDFCGGIYSESVWLDRDQLVLIFGQAGYEVETAFETPNAPNGPASCLLAIKR